MQITSLTDLPSKRAHVSAIKVSFLLEKQNPSGEQVEGRTGEGRGKSAFTKIILRGPRGPSGQRPWAPGLFALSGGRCAGSPSHVGPVAAGHTLSLTEVPAS